MKVYSVSEFNQTIKAYLEEGMMDVAVQGEVTGYRKAKDKLIYFELKDDKSRVLCFMMVWDLKTILEDGMEIRVYGKPSLFVGSGGFHLRVKEIELVGAGALRKALEKLKLKLEKEGLFAIERKRALPRFPFKIGLITSPDAAAYHDVLRILKNRWAGMTVYFYPVSVQGFGAIKQIAEAFNYFNHTREVEVIILTRGGGSLEDLQAFNAEEVARAVFASKIPVVCGVGHERDWTVADLVADQRASTPSNAAERIVPDKREIISEIVYLADRLEELLRQDLSAKNLTISTAVSRMEQGIANQRSKVMITITHFKGFFQHFLSLLEGRGKAIIEKIVRLKSGAGFLLEQWQAKIQEEERVLKTLSPQATLDRGYSITRNLQARKILKDKDEVQSGERISTRLKRGEIESIIK